MSSVYIYIVKSVSLRHLKLNFSFADTQKTLMSRNEQNVSSHCIKHVSAMLSDDVASYSKSSLTLNFVAYNICSMRSRSINDATVRVKHAIPYSTHILEKQGRNTLLPVMSASSSVSPKSPRRHRRNSREHSYETSSHASGSGSRKQHATSPVNYLDKKSSTQRSAARNNRNIDDYEYDNGAVGCITCSCTSKCHHFKRHKVPLSKPLTSSDDTDAEVTWSWHDADDSSWASSAR